MRKISINKIAAKDDQYNEPKSIVDIIKDLTTGQVVGINNIMTGLKRRFKYEDSIPEDFYDTPISPEFTDLLDIVKIFMETIKGQEITEEFINKSLDGIANQKKILAEEARANKIREFEKKRTKKLSKKPDVFEITNDMSKVEQRKVKSLDAQYHSSKYSADLFFKDLDNYINPISGDSIIDQDDSWSQESSYDVDEREVLDQGGSSTLSDQESFKKYDGDKEVPDIHSLIFIGDELKKIRPKIIRLLKAIHLIGADLDVNDFEIVQKNAEKLRNEFFSALDKQFGVKSEGREDLFEDFLPGLEEEVESVEISVGDKDANIPGMGLFNSILRTIAPLPHNVEEVENTTFDKDTKKSPENVDNKVPENVDNKVSEIDEREVARKKYREERRAEQAKAKEIESKNKVKKYRKKVLKKEDVKRIQKDLESKSEAVSSRAKKLVTPASEKRAKIESDKSESVKISNLERENIIKRISERASAEEVVLSNISISDITGYFRGVIRDIKKFPTEGSTSRLLLVVGSKEFWDEVSFQVKNIIESGKTLDSMRTKSKIIKEELYADLKIVEKAWELDFEKTRSEGNGLKYAMSKITDNPFDVFQNAKIYLQDNEFEIISTYNFPKEPGELSDKELSLVRKFATESLHELKNYLVMIKNVSSIATSENYNNRKEVQKKYDELWNLINIDNDGLTELIVDKEVNSDRKLFRKRFEETEGSFLERKSLIFSSEDNNYLDHEIFYQVPQEDVDESSPYEVVNPETLRAISKNFLSELRVLINDADILMGLKRDEKGKIKPFTPPPLELAERFNTLISVTKLYELNLIEELKEAHGEEVNDDILREELRNLSFDLPSWRNRNLEETDSQGLVRLLTYLGNPAMSSYAFRRDAKFMDSKVKAMYVKNVGDEDKLKNIYEDVVHRTIISLWKKIMNVKSDKYGSLRDSQQGALSFFRTFGINKASIQGQTMRQYTASVPFLTRVYCNTCTRKITLKYNNFKDAEGTLKGYDSEMVSKSIRLEMFNPVSNGRIISRSSFFNKDGTPKKFRYKPNELLDSISDYTRSEGLVYRLGDGAYTWDEAKKMTYSGKRDVAMLGHVVRSSILKSLGASSGGIKKLNTIFSECPFGASSHTSEFGTRVSDGDCGLTLEPVSGDGEENEFNLQPRRVDIDSDGIDTVGSMSMIENEDLRSSMEEKIAGGFKNSAISFGCPTLIEPPDRIGLDDKHILMSFSLVGDVNDPYFESPLSSNGEEVREEDRSIANYVCSSLTSISSFDRSSAEGNDTYIVNVLNRIRAKDEKVYYNALSIFASNGVSYDDIFFIHEKVEELSSNNFSRESRVSMLKYMAKYAAITVIGSVAEALWDIVLVCPEGHKFTIGKSIKFAKSNARDYIRRGYQDARPLITKTGKDQLDYLVTSGYLIKASTVQRLNRNTYTEIASKQLSDLSSKKKGDNKKLMHHREDNFAPTLDLEDLKISIKNEVGEFEDYVIASRKVLKRSMYARNSQLELSHEPFPLDVTYLSDLYTSKDNSDNLVAKDVTVGENVLDLIDVMQHKKYITATARSFDFNQLSPDKSIEVIQGVVDSIDGTISRYVFAAQSWTKNSIKGRVAASISRHFSVRDHLDRFVRDLMIEFKNIDAFTKYYGDDTAIFEGEVRDLLLMISGFNAEYDTLVTVVAEALFKVVNEAGLTESEVLEATYRASSNIEEEVVIRNGREKISKKSNLLLSINKTQNLYTPILIAAMGLYIADEISSMVKNILEPAVIDYLVAPNGYYDKKGETEEERAGEITNPFEPFYMTELFESPEAILSAENIFDFSLNPEYLYLEIDNKEVDGNRLEEITNGMLAFKLSLDRIHDRMERGSLSNEILGKANAMFQSELNKLSFGDSSGSSDRVKERIREALKESAVTNVKIGAPLDIGSTPFYDQFDSKTSFKQIIDEVRFGDLFISTNNLGDIDCEDLNFDSSKNQVGMLHGDDRVNDTWPLKFEGAFGFPVPVKIDWKKPDTTSIISLPISQMNVFVSDSYHYFSDAEPLNISMFFERGKNNFAEKENEKRSTKDQEDLLKSYEDEVVDLVSEYTMRRDALVQKKRRYSDREYADKVMRSDMFYDERLRKVHAKIKKISYSMTLNSYRTVKNEDGDGYTGAKVPAFTLMDFDKIRLYLTYPQLIIPVMNQSNIPDTTILRYKTFFSDLMGLEQKVALLNRVLGASFTVDDLLSLNFDKNIAEPYVLKRALEKVVKNNGGWTAKNDTAFFDIIYGGGADSNISFPANILENEIPSLKKLKSMSMKIIGKDSGKNPFKIGRKALIKMLDATDSSLDVLMRVLDATSNGKKNTNKLERYKEDKNMKKSYNIRSKTLLKIARRRIELDCISVVSAFDELFED